MTTHATGTFKSTSWEEQPYSQVEGGPKIARASVANDFTGDIAGSGTLEYLLYYGTTGEGWGSGSFVGYEPITGSLGDRSGSFVLMHSGTFAGSTIQGDWQVVPDSGTGQLRGLHGKGHFAVEEGVQDVPYTLDYDLE